MAEYIEREAAIHAVTECFWSKQYVSDVELAHAIEAVSAADVVPKGAYDQVAWERDVAIEQLREDYGVGLGEKKAADVVDVKHGRWEEADDGDGVVCSVCGEDFCTIYLETERFNFCPNCGCQMVGGENGRD